MESRSGEKALRLSEMLGLLVQEIKTATMIANKIANFFTKYIVLIKHPLSNKKAGAKIQ
jgi:hypothetical protein